MGQKSNRCAVFPFFTCVVLLKLGWGVSPLPVRTGRSAHAAQARAAAEAGLPITWRSLQTANQLRHFLSKLAGGLPQHKNKPSRKTPSLGYIKAVAVR